MYLINPVINSKFSCFNSPPSQHHSFFKHQLLCASKFILYVPSTACGLPAGLNVSERNILTKKSKESKLNRLQYNRFSVLRLSREAGERKKALTREARRAHEPHTPISPVSLVSSRLTFHSKTVQSKKHDCFAVYKLIFTRVLDIARDNPFLH